MTIPTLTWFPTDITGNLGSYTNWNGIQIDAETMVRDLIAALKVFMLPSFSFDQVTTYTQVDATSPAIPQKTVSLGIVGTSGSAGFSAAISTTFNFTTTMNGKARLVLLDSPLGSGGFAPIFPAAFDANIDAVALAFLLPTNAWSGRDNFKPQTLRKVSFDLNDKLQKSYRLV